MTTLAKKISSWCSELFCKESFMFQANVSIFLAVQRSEWIDEFLFLFSEKLYKGSFLKKCNLTFLSLALSVSSYIYGGKNCHFKISIRQNCGQIVDRSNVYLLQSWGFFFQVLKIHANSCQTCSKLRGLINLIVIKISRYNKQSYLGRAILSLKNKVILLQANLISSLQKIKKNCNSNWKIEN